MNPCLHLILYKRLHFKNIFWKQLLKKINQRKLFSHSMTKSFKILQKNWRINIEIDISDKSLVWNWVYKV